MIGMNFAWWNRKRAFVSSEALKACLSDDIIPIDHDIDSD
jgi:hypothetical protein